jgi:hypothetical protein
MTSLAREAVVMEAGSYLLAKGTVDGGSTAQALKLSKPRVKRISGIRIRKAPEWCAA